MCPITSNAKNELVHNIMHMASPFPLILCIFSLLLCSIFFPSKSHSTIPFNGGFEISLIHRDSPQSPFYNHSMTGYDRCLAAAHRSVSRLKHLHLRAASKRGLSNISSELFPDELEYIASYYIGTPPIKVYAFIDSGSDIIWTKGIPYFDASKSFSYTNLSCLNVSCRHLRPTWRTCLDPNQPCTYEFVYADFSTTSGVLASDKFTFEDPDKSLVDVGFLVFGYSFVSSPHFKGHQDGCLGLNQDYFSLIKQLGINKFSHCMVIPDDQGTASRMYFGSRAVISGDLTPLLKGKAWYYITLEGISIGDQMVPIPPGVFNVTGDDDGGVIIDSGTSYTMLRSEGYGPFVAMMHEKVQHLPIVRPPAYYKLCFEGTYEDLQSIPFVTFHFTGANVRLMKETTFLQVQERVWCLAILENDDTLSLIGNIQMRNLWVGYDLERQVISFAPADCPTV